MGLSPDCSSVDSSGGDNNLNLKATELRLGLPGSHSPEREKQLFPLIPVVSGNKRGFSDAPGKASQERSGPANNNANAAAPAAKAQVVGWPPIRAFRKNSLSAASKSNKDEALYVKVSMDGAPYLRKVDLRAYNAYQDLSKALENMFTSFTIGQCGSHGGGAGKEKLSESKLRDLLNGSEYVLTYEDRDGDWMLVGDVPWEMFIETCKKLKIMKGSDAIGLAPRVAEKSQNRN